MMEIPQVKHLEDDQSEADARPERPIQMALRNASVALLAIALGGGGYWWHYHRDVSDSPIAWWVWPGIAMFAVLVCFSHALLAMRFGARRAGLFLKIVCALVLAGMLVGLKIYLQPKNGGV